MQGVHRDDSEHFLKLPRCSSLLKSMYQLEAWKMRGVCRRFQLLQSLRRSPNFSNTTPADSEVARTFLGEVDAAITKVEHIWLFLWNICQEHQWSERNAAVFSRFLPSLQDIVATY